jgi:hypothetical protein
MPSQNNTDCQSVPTKKTAFFVLNPDASLKALFIEQGIQIQRAQALARMASQYGMAEGVTEFESVSILGIIKNMLDQIGAIHDQLMGYETKAQTSETSQTARPLNDDERARFLESLQRHSKLITLPDSVTDPQEKKQRANQRVLMLEGMIELFDMLNALGIRVPADVASIAESEMGRIGV